MSLRLEEIPFELEGRTYLLRANMAVLETIQEAHGGDLEEALFKQNTISGVLELIAAMVNDYAEEQGWPERFTKKQIGRRFSMGSLRASGLIESVMKLITNSLRTDADVSDPDTGTDAAAADETPEASGN